MFGMCPKLGWLTQPVLTGFMNQAATAAVNTGLHYEYPNMRIIGPHRMFRTNDSGNTIYMSRAQKHMLSTHVGDTAAAGAGVAIREVLFEGCATQDYGNRVLQPNAVAHTLALVILLALLFTRLFGAQVLSAVGQAFALLGMGRSSKSKLTNLPSLAIAVRSRLLIGPGSYSMEKHDKYGEVFAATDNSALLGEHDKDHKVKGPRKQSNKTFEA